MAVFSTILPFVLNWEGTKFTDDPQDNGGATRYGITQNALSEFLGRKVSKDEVKNIKMGTVEEIYKKKYWAIIHGDELPEGVALMIFDGAVNHGTAKMIEFVQRAAGVITGGKFGQGTLDAINAKDPFKFIMALSNLRRDRYKNHEDFARFGKGWLNRLNDITNKALAFENKYVIKKPEVVLIMVEDGDETKKLEIPKVEEKSFVEELQPDVDDKLSNETLQKFMKAAGTYSGDIDGLFGKNSKKAMNILLEEELGSTYLTWTDEERKIALGQLFAKKSNIEVGKIDGKYGPQSKQAFKELNYLVLTNKPLPKWRDLVDAEEIEAPDVIVPTTKIIWPFEKEVEKFYGKVGENQTKLTLPFKMKIAWDLDTSISSFSCHEKVHDSLKRIFQKVFDEYGPDAISKLKLDLFGGCLNVRKKRGGSSWSMHSWGIAVDLDPERNQLEWGKNKAAFAKPEYDQFWQIVESEGWISLGRKKDYDWMHFQAARV